MCLFDPNCPVTDGSCNCGQLLAGQSADNSLSPLFFFLNQQTQILNSIIEQNNCVLQYLSTISNALSQSSAPENVCTFNSEGTSTAQSLLDYICGPNPGFQYQIKLASPFPSPAYKERPFSLECQLCDLDGTAARLPQTILFKVSLYTTESPPKLLKNNTVGDKIMKGTTQSESTGAIHFPKVTIKEVSSHFRNSRLFLAVTAEQTPGIKPLIIEDVIVKARKISTNDGTAKKKPRTDSQARGETPQAPEVSGELPETNQESQGIVKDEDETLQVHQDITGANESAGEDS